MNNNISKVKKPETLEEKKRMAVRIIARITGMGAKLHHTGQPQDLGFSIKVEYNGVTTYGKGETLYNALHNLEAGAVKI